MRTALVVIATITILIITFRLTSYVPTEILPKTLSIPVLFYIVAQGSVVYFHSIRKKRKSKTECD